jgi:ABC-type amino acid transport substrate-binding protein
LDDFNRSDITLAVGKGWASESLIRVRLPKAKIVSVDTSTDLLQLFNELSSGRVEATISDGPSAQRFVKEHSNDVKALWLDDPPAFMPAGFALRPTDRTGADFMNVCLRYLKSIGALSALRAKYGLPAVNGNASGH